MDTTMLVSDVIETAGESSNTCCWTARGHGRFLGEEVRDDEWLFYIVSSAAEPEHLNVATAGSTHHPADCRKPHWIDPLKVRLLRPSQPLAKDVLSIYDRTRAGRGCRSAGTERSSATSASKGLTFIRCRRRRQLKRTSAVISARRPLPAAP